jgi:hypothetical protein
MPASVGIVRADAEPGEPAHWSRSVLRRTGQNAGAGSRYESNVRAGRWSAEAEDGRRRRPPAGRPDLVPTAWSAQWTTELLQLVWVLEALVDLEPRQMDLIDRITNGPLISVSDMEHAGILPVPSAARKTAQYAPADVGQGRLTPH